MLISIYRVDIRTKDGRLVHHKSFRSAPAVEDFRSPASDLITARITDGGIIGTIVAPDDSLPVVFTGGEAVLILPDGACLTAVEAWNSAENGEHGLSFQV